MYPDHSSLIVGCLKRAIDYLSKFTIFNCIRWRVCEKNADCENRFTECWVLAALVLAGLSFILAVSCSSRFVIIVAALPIYRVYELVLYQVKILFVDPWNSQAYKFPYGSRPVILAILNYIEVVLWFATLYAICTVIGSLKIYSFVTLTILTGKPGDDGWQFDGQFFVSHIMAPCYCDGSLNHRVVSDISHPSARGAFVEAKPERS